MTKMIKRFLAASGKVCVSWLVILRRASGCRPPAETGLYAENKAHKAGNQAIFRCPKAFFPRKWTNFRGKCGNFCGKRANFQRKWVKKRGMCTRKRWKCRNLHRKYAEKRGKCMNFRRKYKRKRGKSRQFCGKLACFHRKEASFRWKMTFVKREARALRCRVQCGNVAACATW